jgi:ribosomal-protein-alanine N-acetyltransferase
MIADLDPGTSSYHFCELQAADLDQVLAIEQRVYTHPWTRGNFEDSLDSHHEMCGLRDDEGRLAGYFLAMPVVDEVHLLNLAISVERQRQGLAFVLLNQLREYASKQGASSILLEVRVSNDRALEIYRRYGFIEIGKRKGYYPAGETDREDAIVMRMEL